MSYRAVSWAYDQVVESYTTKFVLVTIAEHANEFREAWPSVARICFRTGISRRAVIASIKSLEAAGLIRRTGRLAGRTKTITVWSLGPAESSARSAHLDGEGVHVVHASSASHAQKGVHVVHTEPVIEPVRNGAIPDELKAQVTESVNLFATALQERGWKID